MNSKVLHGRVQEASQTLVMRWDLDPKYVDNIALTPLGKRLFEHLTAVRHAKAEATVQAPRRNLFATHWYAELPCH